MKQNNIKKILTIAGSDSSAGAGIQADLKAITACGGYAMTAITAITAQNTEGVREIEIMSASIVREQIYAVAEDIGIDAIKIGMLPTKEIVDVVIKAIKHYKIKYVVLDPVMVATSGDMLVGGDVAKHIIKNLMPLSTVITPNTPECKFITGMNVIDTNLYDIVARHMMFLGAKNILIKSGHINNDIITDVLYFENGEKASFPFKKIDTKNTHGTGCSLSSAIACYLAQGYSLEKAVKKSEDYIHEAIKKANYKIGNGHGPINHFYSFFK